MIVFDLESDGLLDTITKLHCINMIDTETGQEYHFTDHEFYQDVDGKMTEVNCHRDGNIMDGLHVLHCADQIGGHYIIGYDIPAIDQLHPGMQEMICQNQLDSKVLCQLVYPDLKDIDWARIRKGKLPKDFAKHAGSNKLLHWGVRLTGEAKSDFTPGDFGHTWATIPFIQELDDYCMQDVRANVNLFEHLASKGVDHRCIELEMEVAKIINWQERVGIRFDLAAATEFAKELYEKQIDLREAARKAFPPFYLKAGHEFTPKRPNKNKGYTAGCTMQHIKLVEFNPGSSQHIAIALTRKYKWEPTQLTPTGLPQIDEEVLSALPFPEARVIAKYKMITKRLSQLCEGKQAWMKKVKKDGRIYGRVNQLGCVTGRMSHYSPNLAQVPTSSSPYGAECRALFVSDVDRTIVGCDADALELRMLAHFMARFDNGAYIKVVLEGTKEEGTDIHTRNQSAIGLRKRDVAKIFFYAMLYGSGNYNLGTIILTDWEKDKLTRFYELYPPGAKRDAKMVTIGKRARGKLMGELPALGKLIDAVKKAARRGYLRGLDGRNIPVRALHSAINSLCQSAGAVIMKQALVEMFAEFRKQQLDVIPLLNIHDEVQLSALPEEANNVGRIAADSIRIAGDSFNLRCPLAGDYKIGGSWDYTH